MSIDDAKLFRDACQLHVDNKPLTVDVESRLATFAKKLEPAFHKMMDASSGGVFVKMSSRSAKDAPGQSRTLDEQYKARLQLWPRQRRQNEVALSFNFDFGLDGTPQFIFLCVE